MPSQTPSPKSIYYYIIFLYFQNSLLKFSHSLLTTQTKTGLYPGFKFFIVYLKSLALHKALSIINIIPQEEIFGEKLF